MNRLRLGSFGFALVSLLASSAAAQNAPGFAVNRFEPSERGSDWFANESLDLRGKFRPALGVIGDYQYRPLSIYDANGDFVRAVVRHQLSAHVGGSLVLLDRLRLGVSLPIALYNEGEAARVNGVDFAPAGNQQAVGDLRLGLDLRLLGQYGGPATLAIGSQFWLPTGSKEGYLSDGSTRIAPRLMLAGQIGAFEYAARAGVNIRTVTESINGTPVGTELFFGGAAGVAFANRKLLFGPEVFASTVLVESGAFERRTTPVEGLLGLHYRGGDFRAGIGAGMGLTRGFGTPTVRTLLTIEWAPGYDGDRDKDGILDRDDACPDVPGVKSEDPRRNGCPDRDGDGVFDKDDACPDVPGIATDDPATNGCPADLDTDGDGILDKDDACPTKPGKPNADKHLHGCPDYDSDGDGIIDREDACPDVPGIKTDDPATNGCPDLDRDKDGIPNDQDACPDEPGRPDKDPKRNGCPKAFVKDGQIRILDQVRFKTNSAQIQNGKDSEEVLQAVLKVLTDHPEIAKVSIEGHTDSRGNAANNKRLSNGRAASVVTWLVKHGVDKNRLSSVGYGQEKPIDSNDTEEGRRINRRVEFRIVSE